MDVDLYRLLDLPDDVVAGWSALAERAVEPNVFVTPEFVLAAARELHARHPLLLTVTSGRSIVGCLPVLSDRRWHRAPLRVLRPWRHPYFFLATPLVDRDGPAALRALFGLLRPGASRPDRPQAGWCAGLELWPADGEVAEWTEQALTEVGLVAVDLRRWRRATACRDELRAVEQLLARTERRLTRRLAAATGEVRLVDRSDDPAAVGEFLALEAAGWKGRRATAMVSDPAHARFFRALCHRQRSVGRLELLGLEAGGRTVAMKCSLGHSSTLFYFKAAFDESYARWSPGRLLEVAALGRVLAGRHWSRIDSCTAADNQMINRLLPGRRTLRTAFVAPANAGGRILVGLAPPVVSFVARHQGGRAE